MKNRLFFLLSSVLLMQNGFSASVQDFVSALSDPITWPTKKAGFQEDIEKKRIIPSNVILNSMTIKDIDLSGLDLKGMDFSNCNLVRVILDRCNLIDTKFDEANFTDVSLRNVCLGKIPVNIQASLVGPVNQNQSLVIYDFKLPAKNLILDYSRLMNIQNVTIQTKDLVVNNHAGDRAHQLASLITKFFPLLKLDLKDVNFKDLTLNLSSINLSYCDLSNANLTGAILTEANLKDANLNNSIIKNATFKNCDLTGAFLVNSDLTGSKFSGGSISETKIQGINLTNVEIADNVKKQNIQISEAPSGTLVDFATRSPQGLRDDYNYLMKLSNESQDPILKASFLAGANTLKSMMICLKIDLIERPANNIISNTRYIRDDIIKNSKPIFIF